MKRMSWMICCSVLGTRNLGAARSELAANHCGRSCQSRRAAWLTSSRASSSNSCRCSSVRASWWKIVLARGQRSVPDSSPRRTPMATPSSSTRPAHTIAPALYPNLGLPSRARILRRSSFRNRAIRPGGFAGQRFQDSPRFSQLPPQGEARTVQFLLARCRDCVASERGTISVSAGVQGCTYSVQGRCRSDDRGDGRTDRFFLRPIGARSAAHPRGQALCTCGEQLQALSALSEVPTTEEAGFQQRRVSDVVRAFPAGKDPREIVEKLHRETLKALQVPKVRDELRRLGVEPMVDDARGI